MDSKTFATILRKVIREEIRNAIKQELTEILQEGLQSTINEMKQPAKAVSKPASRKSNVFTNTPYADILNDTEPLRENQSVSAYRDLMNEGMEEIRMTSRDAMNFGVARKAAMSPNAAPSVMEDPETGKVYEVKPEVAAALTRDYSALMKAIDSKKGK